MKTRNLLTGVAILMAGMMGLKAQQVTSTDAITDYNVLHENTTPATYKDSVTVGGGALSDSIEGGGNASNMVMPYFVMPDPFLNGGYDNGDGTFNDDRLYSRWYWSFNGGSPTGGGFQNADFSGTIGGTTDTLNQIFVDWGTAIGNFRIDVYEESNPSNCAGVVQYINVDVIEVPTGDVNNADDPYCESAGTNKTITVNLSGVPPFQFRVDSVVKEIETTGDTTEVSNDSEIITTGASDGSIIGGGTLNDLGNNDWTFVFDVKSMPCNGGKVTIRTYRITGINDRISRKSDRASEAGGNNLYYAADDQAIFTAYPAPTTGNIYNIDN